MQIFLTNLGKYNEGELVGQWLVLPYTESELQDVLKAIGIGKQYEEYFITDYDNCLRFDIGEYENLSTLNEVAERVNTLDEHGVQKLQAVIEHENPDVSEMLNILNCLEEYLLHADINDDEDLGYYYVHDAGIYDLESLGKLSGYIDYEAFGRDMSLELNGSFTSYGWLERL